MSIKNSIKRKINAIVGKNKMEDQINLFYFYLNNFVDITMLPKARGSIRDLQINGLLILKLFDKLCKKENWSYWLDYGTLLGAVRHKGFIPWDDDIDVGMPRKDYEDAKKKIPQYLKNLNLDWKVEIGRGSNCLQILIDTKNTLAYLDIFPYDCCKCEVENFNKKENELNNLNVYFKKQKRKHKSMKKWEKMYSNKDSFSEGNNFYYQSLESFLSHIFCFSSNDIFPLKEFLFEDCLFMIPNNYEKFLLKYYGSNYMQFPRSGILKHMGQISNNVFDEQKIRKFRNLLNEFIDKL